VAFGDRFDNLERRFDDVDRVLMEHGGKTDSLCAQVRSLTQLVGSDEDQADDE
jgi:hypothetical protein